MASLALFASETTWTTSKRRHISRGSLMDTASSWPMLVFEHLSRTVVQKMMSS